MTFSYIILQNTLILAGFFLKFFKIPDKSEIIIQKVVTFGLKVIRNQFHEV